MNLRLQFASITLLILLGCAPVYGAGPGMVSGCVRDSAGVPQVGAVVELLRADQSVILSVFTDAKGHYLIPNVYPGRYAVKAIASSYLPSMRENLRFHSSTVVNLTLNTLYEVMQWLPAEPKDSSARPDDWAWTLRSAANRPLLRWLEDGPLVVVSDGRGSAPKLRARLMATGQSGSFGESGERISATVEDTPSESRELLARVDFDPETNAGMESMLGFRQDLGYSGSVRTLAAVRIESGMESGDSQGMNEAAIRTTEEINLGDLLQAEAGSEEVMARFSHGAAETLLSSLPFGSITWKGSNSSVSYRVNTSRPESADSDAPSAILPELSMNNGRLAMEQGLHQEISWERNTERSGLSFRVYSESVSNPVLEAATQGNGVIASQALTDSVSNLLRVAGPGYSTQGFTASYVHRFLSGNQLRFSYANGSSLALGSMVHPTTLAQLVAAAHPHHTQTYEISFSGTLEGTGTRWRASYRWQPEDNLTPVASLIADAREPYLNLHVHQRLGGHASGSRFEARVDLLNLLAQGYQPFLLGDGSVLVFAQDQRAVRGGLALIF